MAIVKNDIYPGSSLTVGVQSNQQTVAIRRVHITAEAGDIPNDETGSYEAIQAVLSQPGIGFHPSLTELPLDLVRVRRWGPTKFTGELVYRLRFQGVAGQEPFANAFFRGGYVTTRWFQLPFDENDDPAFDAATGLPNGILDTPNVNAPPEYPEYRPKPYKLTLPIARISVPYTLPFNPFPNVGLAQGRVNNQTLIGLGGFNFPPGTLRFDAVDTNHVDAPGTSDDFSGFYHFTAILGGFLSQTVVFDAIGAAMQWSAKTYEDHPRFDFPVFPI